MKKSWIHRGNNLVGVLCTLFILVVAGWVFASFKYTKEHCTLWGCDYEIYLEEEGNTSVEIPIEYNK